MTKITLIVASMAILLVKTEEGLSLRPLKLSCTVKDE